MSFPQEVKDNNLKSNKDKVESGETKPMVHFLSRGLMPIITPTTVAHHDWQTLCTKNKYPDIQTFFF